MVHQSASRTGRRTARRTAGRADSNVTPTPTTTLRDEHAGWHAEARFDPGELAAGNADQKVGQRHAGGDPDRRADDPHCCSSEEVGTRDTSPRPTDGLDDADLARLLPHDGVHGGEDHERRGHDTEAGNDVHELDDPFDLFLLGPLARLPYPGRLPVRHVRRDGLEPLTHGRSHDGAVGRAVEADVQLVGRAGAERRPEPVELEVEHGVVVVDV